MVLKMKSNFLIFNSFFTKFFILLSTNYNSFFNYNLKKMVYIYLSFSFNILVSFLLFNFKGLEVIFNKSKLVYNSLNVEPNYFLDNLTILFCLLTGFLIPVCILLAWDSMHKLFIKYTVIFFFLELFLINVFCAGDLIVFYISFECILIPMFFLIGMVGSRQRRVHATLLFFLYTLGGSLLMLFSIIVYNYQYGTTNMSILLTIDEVSIKECFLWVCFFIAFAVKIPLMPVHLWLPEAHVESPTGGSVALAGILLKLGTYGILRFLLPLFPFGSQFFTPFIFLICFLSIFFGCLTTLRQIDIKKIIAYSSVIHMSYLVLGLFTFNLEGILGSVILMVAHAFISGGLFVCVGILYDRYSTRLIKYYGGLTVLMPVFSTFFLLFTLGNISFPGTFNFIGEFLVLLGLFIDNSFSSILIIFIMILSTCYALWLYNKLFSGLLTSYVISVNKKYNTIFLFFERSFLSYYTDINLREIFCLCYLLFPAIFFGLNPMPLINFLENGFKILILNSFN